MEMEDYEARERNLEEFRREISELEERNARELAEYEVREWTENDAREIAEYEAHEREVEEEHNRMLDLARERQDEYEREEEYLEMALLRGREAINEYVRAEEEREMARQYWGENYWEDVVRRDLPTPIRLDFHDRYSMTEDEWDEMWDRSTSYSAPKIMTNPKIGDIVTFTIHVNDEVETKMRSEEFDCPICYASVCKWDAINLNCTHVFCGSCVSTHLDTLHTNHKLLPSCALCRTEYSLFEIPNPEISNKIEMVLRK
jgi:hypothetical protein